MLKSITHFIIFSGSLALCYSVLAQDSKSTNINNVTEKHSNFFKPIRENFHLHLNKSTFLAGERMYFKAYVYDQNSQKPSKNTGNLYVGIYDERGKELVKKMIYIENGTGRGDFELNSLSQGEYFIKAYTNWMKNFEQSNSFYQTFQIIGPEMALQNPKISDEQAVQVHFFPESGLILKGSENTIGFKISDQKGAGLEVDGISLLQNNETIVIASIFSNYLGFGRFVFTPGKGNVYHLNIKLKNGGVVKKKLPEPVDKGVLLSVNTVQPLQLLLTLNTNENTLKEQWGELFYIAFHKNSRLLVEEFILQDQTHVFNFKKSELPTGVNTLTLFDSKFQPIAKRIFFNEFGLQSPEVVFSETAGTQKDTVQLVIDLDSSIVSPFSISASVLPAATQADQLSNSILSSFWLMPYLEYPIEKPAYYLEQLERKRLYELDLMLLTQGAGSYDWETIFNYSGDKKYAWETGVKIHGKVKDADLAEERELWLYPEDMEQMFASEIKEDKTFDAQAILYKKDSLAVSITDNKGRMRKPEIELYFTPRMQISTLDVSDVKIIQESRFHMPLAEPFNVLENTIFLDEVEVAVPRQRDRFQISARLEGRIVTDADIKSKATIANYLRALGFKISVESSPGVSAGLYVRSRLPDPGGGYPRIPVSVEGMVSDGAEILNMPLSRVQSVVFDANKSKFVGINLRSGKYIGPDAPKNHIKFLIDEGYARPKEYEPPLYPTYDHNFEKYGAISWIPEIQMNSREKSTISIPRMDQDKVKIFLEGMGPDGTLISTVKTLQLN